MPHCTKCGTMVSETSAFCPNCGQPQGVAAPAGARSGLSENTGALLSYVLGWVSGLIFFLVDKRPYVRFHAAQSLVVFGGLHIVRMVIGMIFGVRWFLRGWSDWTTFGPATLLLGLLDLLGFVLWIVCMIKAYQGERFKIPIAAEIAENLAGH